MKTIKVKSHLRKGKSVKAHARGIKKVKQSKKSGLEFAKVKGDQQPLKKGQMVKFKMLNSTFHGRVHENVNNSDTMYKVMSDHGHYATVHIKDMSPSKRKSTGRWA